MSMFIFASLSSYISSCVITSSSLFSPFREYIIKRTSFFAISGNRHFAECRLCMSFWTSGLSVMVFGLDAIMILPVYGLAYFLATQER